MSVLKAKAQPDVAELPARVGQRLMPGLWTVSSPHPQSTNETDMAWSLFS